MDPKSEGAQRKPLRFRTHFFEPRDWEKRLIHRYSVRRPLWWRLWLKVREFGARVSRR